MSSTMWVVGKTDPITNKYTMGHKIGQPGQFGYAMVVTHKGTGEKRAVKIITKARFGMSADKSFHPNQLRMEIATMKAMSHKHIIKMYEVFESKRELFIVMELCTGGELFDRVKEIGNFSEKVAAGVLRQMCRGIAYMHAMNIAHCDLKPDNFLFVDSSPDSCLKIIDFGMSKFVESRSYFNTLCGTPYYVAPEVIDGRYSKHCDMWSLGVVMFVMLFGYPPFYADEEVYGSGTDDQIFKLVQKGLDFRVREGYGAHFPADIPVSESARHLMTQLLNPNTTERITATEALEHSWLRGESASTASLALDNLRQFAGKSKFKSAVLDMMSDSLSEDELASMMKTFTAIDTNGDGNITVDELAAAIKKTGGNANLAEIQRMMEEADWDGDGQLSYKEMLMTAVHKKLINKEERLLAAFSKLDLDGNGKVTAEELRAVLGDDHSSAALIIEADQDGDGEVDYDEFIHMWTQKSMAESC